MHLEILNFQKFPKFCHSVKKNVANFSFDNSFNKYELKENIFLSY